MVKLGARMIRAEHMPAVSEAVAANGHGSRRACWRAVLEGIHHGGIGATAHGGTRIAEGAQWRVRGGLGLITKRSIDVNQAEDHGATPLSVRDGGKKQSAEVRARLKAAERACMDIVMDSGSQKMQQK